MLSTSNDSISGILLPFSNKFIREALMLLQFGRTNNICYIWSKSI